MKSYFILLISFLTFSCLAQNYSSFPTQHVGLFEPISDVNIRGLIKGKYIRGIKKIDVEFEAGDTIIYFQNEFVCEDNLDSYSSVCHIGSSWLGSKIIKRNNLSEVYFNYEGLEITIKTNLKINDKWILWQSKIGDYIEAEITKHDIDTFLNVIDSIKTISLQYKNVDGDVIPSLINENPIKLSKNFGFIETYNFRDFPQNERNEDLVLHKLVGTSKKNIGSRLLTIGEVFDFEIDDEFHLKTISDFEEYPEKYRIKQVIDKDLSENLDTIKYKITDTWWTPDNREIVHYDTIVLKITNLWVTLDSLQTLEYNSTPLLPFEVYSNNPELECFNYILGANEKYNNRYHLSSSREKFMFISWGENGFYNYSGNTSMVLGTPIHLDHIAIEGCGIYSKYISSESGDSFINLDEELLFFKKGEETWGTPLSIYTSNPQFDITHSIHIYPNPTTSNFRIVIEDFDTDSVSYYSIYNAAGKFVQKGEISSVETLINLSHLNAGLYFLRINEDNITTKIIKQ